MNNFDNNTGELERHTKCAKDALSGSDEGFQHENTSNDRLNDFMNNWERNKHIEATDIKTFTEKYINYFLIVFDPKSASYYDVFASSTFPNECRSLGFEMDCGKSFVDAYGENAWYFNQSLLLVIDKINNLEILGAALFSKWRFFNHWSCDHATEEDKNWFLTILRRIQIIASGEN